MNPKLQLWHEGGSWERPSRPSWSTRRVLQRGQMKNGNGESRLQGDFGRLYLYATSVLPLSVSSSARYRSASSAPIQPEPAAVIAWR